MKKQILSLLLAGVLAVSSVFAGVGTYTTPVNAEETTQEYNFVSGADAVAAIDSTDTVIIDVRSAVNYAKGHLKGSLSAPLFDSETGSVTTGSDALADAFNAIIAAKADTLKGKNIYILCNSGARGAQNATALLIAAGYSNDVLFTITNGAKDETVKAASYYVTAAYAVSKIGAEDTVILDVRSAVNYEKGHLPGALSAPVFDKDNNVTTESDELAEAFNKTIADNATLLADKNILILCNSGARGAVAGTSLLKKAGYSADKLFTIEGGAKNHEIQWNYELTYNFVSGADALSDKSAVILDVRSDVTYAAGFVKGSLHQAVFDKDNNVTNGTDDLSDAFTKFVTGNKDLAGKKIYILCNSGKRGAQAATRLLLSAGYEAANIYTITDGATDASIKAVLTVNVAKVSSLSVKKSGTKVKLSWKKVSGAVGYQISKSTSKKGTKIVATVSGTSKTLTATKGKTYYYKVRAYKVVNGKKVYGSWSTVKSYKRK